MHGKLFSKIERGKSNAFSKVGYGPKDEDERIFDFKHRVI